MTTPSAHVHAALARWFSELTHAGLFATDADLHVIVWNRWMEIHTRRQAADVIGRPLFELYPELVGRGLDARYQEALRDGRVSTLSYGLHGYIIPAPPTNPDLGLMEMPQSGRIAPLRDEHAVIGTVTVVENVSERLASDAELRRQIEAQKAARATAENALRDKDEFLSTLSHELRTPLNAVLGWARILMTRRDDPALLARALTVIERNAIAQAAMIDDILDVARVVSGKLRLEMAALDLAPIVLAAADVVAPAALAKHLTVRTVLDPDAPQVLGDPGRLQQIVGNLLSNAVKFTDAGGTIDVVLSTLDDAVQLVVSDTGRGIDAAFLPFVFERFRQGDVSSSKRQGGLGLGLALARDLVELHGGTIRAESAGERHGAVFTIRLPILAASNATAPAKADTRQMADGALSLPGVVALVVEDESDSRDLLAAVLERYGAKVVAVSSGEEAIARLRRAGESPIHVVVSDIGMPGQDGYELMHQIRTLPAEVSSTPAVAVTGHSTQQDRKRALAAGYRAHVAKPIDAAELAAAVKRVLGERSFS